jgi:hypothetical protein
LFKAWLAEQPTDTRVLFVRTKREGALLLRALKVLGYRAGATELNRNDLRAAIRYELVPGPLDEYLRACAGVVEFGDYKPTTAVLVMPISEHTVSKATGLATNRSNCGEAPFVLLDRAHWLPGFLLQAADLAAAHESIRPPLREVCELLVRDIALGSTKAVRRESVQAANIWLTRLYAVIDGLDTGGEWQALHKRKMMVMSEIVGLGKPRAGR